MLCACASLRRAARAVTHLYAEALRPHGLHPTQLTLLHVLDRRGELTQGDLGSFLVLDSTTLTRTLRPLIGRRLIRARAGDDARQRVLSLTATGRRTLAEAQPAWERVQERLRRQVGAEQGPRLLAELAAVAGAAQAA